MNEITRDLTVDKVFATKRGDGGHGRTPPGLERLPAEVRELLGLVQAGHSLAHWVMANVKRNPRGARRLPSPRAAQR